MPIMENVICMKWGTKFSPMYVNILASRVRQNLKRPHRFVCFTDDPTGLRSDLVETFPLPELDLPAELPERGWNKLTLFQSSLGDLQGRALFLDLDIVIADKLDPFFELPGEFRIIQDWNLPGRDIGNSSVFRFTIGKYPDILETFLREGERLRSEHRNEQAVLSWFMRQKGLLEYWPKEWCLSFKKHYMRRFPLGYFLRPQQRSEAKIIVFHGKPNPDAIQKGWHSSSFLRAVRPTPWLSELWSEIPRDEEQDQ